MSRMAELLEARYWAEEARRCARISVWLSRLSVALAVVGIALSAWCIFLKHRAVGEDGVGRAASTETDRMGEAGASSSRNVSDDGTVEHPFAESVRKRDASHADLADSERHGTGVCDDDGGVAAGAERAKDYALWLVSLNQMLHGTDGRFGAAFSGLCGAACVARVKDRDRKRGDGNDKCKNLHGGDYTTTLNE